MSAVSSFRSFAILAGGFIFIVVILIILAIILSNKK